MTPLPPSLLRVNQTSVEIGLIFIVFFLNVIISNGNLKIFVYEFFEDKSSYGAEII